MKRVKIEGITHAEAKAIAAKKGMSLQKYIDSAIWNDMREQPKPAAAKKEKK